VSAGNVYGSIPEDALTEDDEEDELFGEAKATVVSSGKASTSFLQRKLGIGYSRAAKLMDILEEKGVIGPADGAKPREVLLKGDNPGGVVEP
jgi:S-DNA-T family DNA segregation ATPase FtsK/SpoIIIE